MSEEFSHIDDALYQLEARTAFINTAMQAISEADPSTYSNRKAWEGLFYITQDILNLIAQARKLAA